MTQAQVKYLRQRAEQIYAKKASEISVEFVTPAVQLTNLERVEALKAGRFTWIGEPNGAPHQFFYGISFTDETRAVTDVEGQTAALKELKDNYTKLMDEIMLGDNEEALAMLKDFEANG